MDVEPVSTVGRSARDRCEAVTTILATNVASVIRHSVKTIVKVVAERRYRARRLAARQAAMESFFSGFLGPGDLCFDIGANIGDFTEAFVRLGAHVVCIEPQATCVARLRRRFASSPQVRIVRNGVADQGGVAELCICDDAPDIATFSSAWRTAGRFASSHSWRRTERVELVTLDQLIDLHGMPRFCKIDVEGFELPVLRGLSRRIPFISFEFTRELWAEGRECLDRLLELGYRDFNYSLGETFRLATEVWVPVQEIDERVRAIADPGLWGDLYARAPTEWRSSALPAVRL